MPSLYFAYGAPQDADLLLHHPNQSYRTITGIAKLEESGICFPRYTNTWRGCVASFEECPCSTLWDYLLELSSEEWTLLDRPETVRTSYDLCKVTVVTEPGDIVEAVACRARHNLPKNKLWSRAPSSAYLTAIRSAAKAAGLPAHWIERQL